MSQSQAIFDTLHGKAFLSLGAVDPRMHWSAFNVPRNKDNKGKETLFVTTIWNYLERKGESGSNSFFEPAIAKDQADGTFWYRIEKPSPLSSKQRKAHWTGFELALSRNMPIVGVLKDVQSKRCSLAHIFDCGNAREDVNGGAIWIEIKPRLNVGCEVGVINIRQVTGQGQVVDPLVMRTMDFEKSVHTSSLDTSAQRQKRMAIAAKIPNRMEVTTTVFDRNPDVVAEVRWRAHGICEGCRRAAPFLRRSDGSPYLEVHHRVHLANGGEDTVENAVALCPNCHRAAHYA